MMQKINFIVIVVLLGLVLFFQFRSMQKIDDLQIVIQQFENKFDSFLKKMKFSNSPVNSKVQKKVTIPIGKSYTQGSKEPLIIIVEFTDIECIYCAKLAPTLERLVQEFPDKVQVVFKHFPLSFHKKAISAHIALLAAGEQNKFFEYRYKLAQYSQQLTPQIYVQISQEVGLDLEKFQASMLNQKDKINIINNDILLGRKLGVQGTPTLFVNGVKIKDSSYRTLKKLILEKQKIK